LWRRKKEDEQEPEAVGAAGDDAVAVEVEPEWTPEERAELHEQTERALQRTRRSWFGRLGGLFERPDFGEELWDELEEMLISADTGLATTEKILGEARRRVRDEGVKQSAGVREILREELVDVLERPAAGHPAWALESPPPLLIILVIGVNGAGKTTTIAKMAHSFKQDGATVILGAADTFRAAAIDQLRVWGDRVGVRVVSHRPGADPGAVVFDTLTAAENARAQVVIVDTAGRLHTKTNLMEELKKINRIIQRNYPDGPHETLLVLDATTGQNGLLQAKTFTDAVGVTGIVLAKLDGTAKGGIAFAIAHDLGIPVRFIGTGERLEHLAPFNAAEFVDSLLAPE
jgi:fused signal recognition particle receptor